MWMDHAGVASQVAVSGPWFQPNRDLAQGRAQYPSDLGCLERRANVLVVASGATWNAKLDRVVGGGTRGERWENATFCLAVSLRA
jgi:hypothetical protein